MKYLKKYEEVYYNSRKDLEGYIDANDLVGQKLWFHTNRTHRNNGWNGMIGIYDTSPSGRKAGLAGKYTNEVRLSEPIFFQTSESGAETIKQSDKRILIAGVSGVVVPTNSDTSEMVKITYNPFDVAYFHEIEDEDKKEIVSAEEVYFNASEDGNWEIWAKNPKYKIKTFESVDMEQQIYQQVLDSVKDCFQEFEDNDWYWSEGYSVDRLSYHPMPHFKYIMKEREDEYIHTNKKRFEFTGSMDSNGEISWEDKSGEENEEFQDFMIALKRLQEETGLDFKFSYNNLGGEKRIIIQGRI